MSTFLSSQAFSKDILRTPTHLTSFYFLFSLRWPLLLFPALIETAMQFCCLFGILQNSTIAGRSDNQPSHPRFSRWFPRQGLPKPYSRRSSGLKQEGHLWRFLYRLTIGRGWTEFMAHGRVFIGIRGFQDPGFYLFQPLVFLFRSMGCCVHCQ